MNEWRRVCGPTTGPFHTDLARYDGQQGPLRLDDGTTIDVPVVERWLAVTAEHDRCD